ncbi:MAG: hypothetical protein EPN55_13750 [Gammaproteobacteria bacterium]|nr:MAG: hypothetical protein EPN55_13750 [Gammaproteobacteria bacterium]
MNLKPAPKSGLCFFRMENSSSQNHTKAALTSLVVAGLIAVIPFMLPHHGLATAFYSEWAAFALGVAACFPFLHKIFWLHLRIPHSAVWSFSFVVLIAVQALFVDHAYATQPLVPAIYIAWAAVLIVLGAWIREQLGLERSVSIFAWALLVGGIAHALLGLVQYFDIYGKLAPIIDPRTPASIYGNIGQRNHYATQISLACFGLVYLRATDRIHCALATTLMTLFAFVLTASGSRAAAVYIVAGVLLSLIFYSAAKTAFHRRSLQATGLLLALFLLFQFLLPLLNDCLKSLLDALGFDTSGFDIQVMWQRNAAEGIDARISEFCKAWLMFLEAPLLGVGIGNYGWHSFNYQALPEFAGVIQGNLFHHSHNLIMQVLAEFGAAGLLLLLIIATSWLRQALPHWRSSSHWLILALAMVLLLHSFVEYPLWYSYFLGIAAVLLGIGSEDGLKIKFTPGLGQFAAGATLVLSGVILIITLLGVYDLSYIHRFLAAATPQQVMARLHAISKNPLLTPWAEISIAQHQAPDRSKIENQLLLTTRVVQYRPNSYNVNRQIIYLALAGKSAEASTLMRKGFAAYPTETDFPRYACGWKLSPAEEIRSLWAEADKIAGNRLECEIETSRHISPLQIKNVKSGQTVR